MSIESTTRVTIKKEKQETPTTPTQAPVAEEQVSTNSSEALVQAREPLPEKVLKQQVIPTKAKVVDNPSELTVVPIRSVSGVVIGTYRYSFVEGQEIVVASEVVPHLIEKRIITRVPR